LSEQKQADSNENSFKKLLTNIWKLGMI